MSDRMRSSHSNKGQDREMCNGETTHKTIPGVFDFTAHMKSVRPAFNRFGQHEPATVRIKNIITQYVGDKDGCGIEELIKELMQNSDDAGATEIHFVLDKRQLPSSRVWEEWRPMQGPALCVQNNSVFTDNDIESIQRLGVGSKSTDPDKTGQFGIGFNVVYQLTDCPILLSDHKDICLFDPHLKYVPGACDERPGGHVDLRQDGNFAKLFPDFMACFLRGQVDHAGCTVFRFPLRQPGVTSKICDMTFAPADIDAIEHVFQSVDFRMFIHSALLFTKHLCQVKVSKIEDDGKTQLISQVNKRVLPNKLEMVKSALKRLSNEIKLLMEKKIKPTQVTKFSLSYEMHTEDSYLKNDWLINQTFGFHGDLNTDDQQFLIGFYGEESKRFLPMAGIASKLNSNSPTVSYAYSFLPLPISTSLPSHVNGHFAIHASRRGIWEHTSFGRWNTILRENVIAPAYGHFLRDSAEKLSSKAELKWWIKLLPDISKVKDEFFSKLVQSIYRYTMVNDLCVVPIFSAGHLSFQSASNCLFVTSDRNECVENVLLRLKNHICTLVEVGMKFKMAQCDGICYLSPEVALNRLKSSDINLPQNLFKTDFSSVDILNECIQYVLLSDAGKDYTKLIGAPLLLTADLMLRHFAAGDTKYCDSEYSDLVPHHPHLFIHQDLCDIFSNRVAQKSSASPIKPLNFFALSQVLLHPSDFMNKKWLSLFWKFVKENSSRSDVSVLLSPCSHLPLIPLTDGRIVNLNESSHILSKAEASKNIQMVIGSLNIVCLDASYPDVAYICEKEFGTLATPFMLNAALPAAFLTALNNSRSVIDTIKIEHAEILLQYLGLDVKYISDNKAAQTTIRSLPIFEDVEGNYKKLDSKQSVILDSCIPTYGIANWMEKSNCLLLREKLAYNDLYNAIGLEKKNAVEVYLDDIFPNFAAFDDDLRQSHLNSLRSSIVPLLKTYADLDTQERFWAKLSTLPCIPFKGDLKPASYFRDPEQEVLALLDGYYPLPLDYSDDDWLVFFRQAGLKKDLTESDLISCAEKVTTLTTAGFSENKAQLVLESACKFESLSDECLKKLCQIRFIPQEQIPVDNILLQSCPPLTPLDKYVNLDHAVVHENEKNCHMFKQNVLCWSVSNVLPKWVTLTSRLTETAQVVNFPSVSMVCQHIKNLTESLPQKPSLSAFKSYRKVILFMPSDIDADVLYPYAFCRPSELAKHDDLLRHIGAVQTPTPDMYADILHSLWLDFGSAHPLQTNDKQTASLAVYGLFTAIQKQGQRLTATTLCLPSDKAMMSLSTELLIADNEALARTVKDRNFSYMCSLSSCNLTKPAKDLVFFLPESLRPRLLSQIVTEQVVVDVPCGLGVDCLFQNQYQYRLHSDTLRRAVWLIAKLSEDHRSQFSSDLGRLKLLEVVCFCELSGYLMENGRLLEDTRIEKTTHIESSLASSKLYIQHQDTYPGNSSLVAEVVSAVKSVICYNENYYIDSGALTDILKCESDEDIEKYLIEQGFDVKEDDMTRPRPGTLVPSHARELFTYDPDVIYQSKEYVGYLPKNSDDMIYARILKESESTESEDVKPILRDYDIDTGRGYPVQVNATDLFKESRRQNLDQFSQLIISDVQTPQKSQKPDKHSNIIIEEAKRTVTRLLNEVYSDPTLWKKREKVKKMLLLKWHPDKCGNSLLSTEVFKHLKIEIDRVEEKYRLSDDEDDEEEEETFYEWEEVETQSKTEEKNADKTDSQETKSRNLVGDLSLADRWLKQAEHDYKTAKHLEDSRTGYEWACHICCEVIRKLLVAAIAATTTLTMELESTRFTDKLFNALNKFPDAPGDLLSNLTELSKLKVDETTTRQLSVHGAELIPAQVFTQSVCHKVISQTEQIQKVIKDYIESQRKKNSQDS